MQHVIGYKINAKYKGTKGDNGKMVYETDDKGEKIIEVASHVVTVNLEAPAFAEVSAQDAEKLYLSDLRQFVAPFAREADANGATEVSCSVTVPQLLGDRTTFSDELIEAFEKAFTDYLVKAGKNEYAVKVNMSLTSMSANAVRLVRADYVTSFQKNLQAFAESLETSKLAEFEPVITRAATRADDAVKQTSAGI